MLSWGCGVSTVSTMKLQYSEASADTVPGVRLQLWQFAVWVDSADLRLSFGVEPTQP